MSVRTNAGRCNGSPYIFVATGFVKSEGSLGSENWEIITAPGRAEPAENRVRCRTAKVVTGKKY